MDQRTFGEGSAGVAIFCLAAVSIVITVFVVKMIGVF